MSETRGGPKGTAYELDASAFPDIRMLWYVHLTEYHPVLEWFAAILSVEGWDHVFSIAPIDPETYIEEGFDRTRLESCKVIDSETLKFPLKGVSVLEAEFVARELVAGLLYGKIVPDKFEQGAWNKVLPALVARAQGRVHA